MSAFVFQRFLSIISVYIPFHPLICFSVLPWKANMQLYILYIHIIFSFHLYSFEVMVFLYISFSLTFPTSDYHLFLLYRTVLCWHRFPLIYYCAKILTDPDVTRLSLLDSARVCQPAEDQRGSPGGHRRDRTCSEFGPGPAGFAPTEARQRTMPRSSTVSSPLWGPAAHR